MTWQDAAQQVDEALSRLERVIGAIGDGDLHRAASSGGWTVAQLVSHINLCSVLYLGDLQRLGDDPELDFFFREEVGHDALGYPPPTTELARLQLGRTRRSLSRSLPAVSSDTLTRQVEIPDLGVMTIGEWTPLILGHLVGHVQQAIDVLADRGVLPKEVG